MMISAFTNTNTRVTSTVHIIFLYRGFGVILCVYVMLLTVYFHRKKVMVATIYYII
jgi:hypothetical protein